jgi:hypothetical protein
MGVEFPSLRRITPHPGEASMPECVSDRTRLVSTALARFRPGVVPQGDMQQEAWLACLEAERDYDPRRHRCTLAAFLVNSIRSRLSLLCQRAARGQAERLPAGLASRESSPLDGAILAERMEREAERKRQRKRPT